MRTFILLLALALGAIGALYQLDGGEPTAGAPVPASLPSRDDVPAAAPVPTGTGAGTDIDSVQAMQADILARPLFARSRQPGDDTAAPVQQQTADAVFAGGQARLIGVYLAPPVRRALVRFADAEPEWLSEGETSRGWTIRNVTTRYAVMAGPSGELTLDLHAPAN
jgi:hypothetical protein